VIGCADGADRRGDLARLEARAELASIVYAPGALSRAGYAEEEGL